MKVDGYIRVSRVAGREGESFISPAEQRDRIAAWAKSRGASIARFHEDLDQPGSKSDRPGLKGAMERVRKGTVQGIVVWRLDRFGRSAVDNARLLEELRQLDAALFTVAEGIDTSAGPMGEFMASIFSAFAKLELDRIRDSWSSARERAVGRGVHVASRTPTGYEKGPDGRLRPGKAAPAVRRAFEAKAAGASWGELSEIMEKAGVKTPYGSENWTNRSLWHLLTNRVYLGEARSGEFTNPEAHEPIADERTLRAAQSRRAAPSRGAGSLLGGIIRCAGCRFVMKADKMTTRSGERVRIYRCRGKRAGGRCAAPASVLGSVVEPWVIERFRAEVGQMRLEGVAADEELAAAEALVREAEAELIAYRDSGAAAVLGPRFADGLRARAERLEQAEADVAELRERAAGSAIPALAELDELWPELPVAERNRILRGAIDAVFVRATGRRNVAIGERAKLFWLGEAPANLPGPGRRGLAPTPLAWD
jgi:site-specific DNA recombinase